MVRTSFAALCFELVSLAAGRFRAISAPLTVLGLTQGLAAVGVPLVLHALLAHANRGRPRLLRWQVIRRRRRILRRLYVVHHVDGGGDGVVAIANADCEIRLANHDAVVDGRSAHVDHLPVHQGRFLFKRPTRHHVHDDTNFG